MMYLLIMFYVLLICKPMRRLFYGNKELEYPSSSWSANEGNISSYVPSQVYTFLSLGGMTMGDFWSHLLPLRIVTIIRGNFTYTNTIVSAAVLVKNITYGQSRHKRSILIKETWFILLLFQVSIHLMHPDNKVLPLDTFNNWNQRGWFN